MEDENWKIKLRYGKLSTPYKHYTALADGFAENEIEDFSCPKGNAWITMKTWATSVEQSADIVRFVSRDIGFTLKGKIEFYETEPTKPPKEKPYAYEIKFTPYN